MTFQQDSADFLFSININMIWRATSSGKIAIWVKNLGVRGKKMAFEEVDVIASAKNYIFLES